MLTMTRPRQSWTTEEDMILRQAVEKAKTQGAVSWHEIASFLPGRTNKDCRKRWHGTTDTKVNKGPWTKAEDERLSKAVQHHGTKWAVVASVVGTRLPDQCSKRWMHALNPEIDHSQWTPDEDNLLIHAVEQYGRCWQQIVSLYFHRRSSLSAKNRYHLLQRRLQSEPTGAAVSAGDSIELIELDSGMEMTPPWESPTSDGGLIGTLPSISPFPSCDLSGGLLSESLAFPFPSSVTEEYNLNTNSYRSSTLLTPSVSDIPRSQSRPNSSHRRVTIQAVCPVDNLGDMFQAVTDLSIAAVFKTDT
ncbi:hypothetical protein N7510_009583 [Penicillium lagena]|uniref:uncharacterized protein n=1 Tax=Penicillium lagena TaxID=94218 RepID=UPI00254040B0|nr:uncharacterized protein N7510_009583 [Penicillium lagena]KAJ5604429.1 hypothetical protein N7510_009583 [Penicillium lagena]